MNIEDIENMETKEGLVKMCVDMQSRIMDLTIRY